MPLATKRRETTKVVAEKVEQRYGEPKVRFRVKVEDEGHTAIVVEESPRMTIVHYKTRALDFYRVWKPWSYTIVHFTGYGGYLGASVFFSYKRLKDVDERKLLLAPLPNVLYRNVGWLPNPCICIGNSKTFHGSTLDEKALDFNKRFWHSSFNWEIQVSRTARPPWFTAASWSGNGDYTVITNKLLETWVELTEKGEKLKFKPALPAMRSVNLAVKWLATYLND